MRPRSLLLGLASAGVSAACLGIACIPNPSGDFDKYDDRTQGMGPDEGDGGGGFDGAPPTEATEGLYYGACLTQLAFGRTDRVFNFYVTTKFTPEGAGGQLELTLQPLKLNPETNGPPATFSLAENGTGDKSSSPAGAVAGDGKYTLDLGVVLVPGNANPITGRDVRIEGTTLVGRFAEERFCARLSGQVTQPTQIPLEAPRNICQFVAAKDGDPTPILTEPADFAASACPE